MSNVGEPYNTPWYDLEEIPNEHKERYNLPEYIKCFWLSKVYVPEDLRGQGAGKKVVRQAQEEVPDGAIILLRLAPFGSNATLGTEDLRTFYLNCGFINWRVCKYTDYMIWRKR